MSICTGPVELKGALLHPLPGYVYGMYVYAVEDISGCIFGWPILLAVEDAVIK